MMIYHSKIGGKKMAGFRAKRKKSCYFTDNKVEKIDWTDYELLRRFVSDRGKILPRRVTGTKVISKRIGSSN